MTPLAFVRTYYWQATTASRQAGVTVGTILTQWAIETGWGTSQLAVSCHNLAGNRYYTPAYAATRDPANPGFACYPNGSDFVADYVHRLELPYYVNVRGAVGTEAELAALGHSPWDAGHYRTSATAAPGSSLLAIWPKVKQALAAITPSAPGSPTTYTVRAGDSLSRIAFRFNIPGGWVTLWHLNLSKVPDPNLIRPGLVLRLRA